MARPKKAEYVKYAEQVLSGKIVAGHAVKLACSRFLRDLSRKDLRFRADVVENKMMFVGMFKHFKGKSSGKQFLLQPWQQFIYANLFGFYWKESGRRRYTSSYIEISRKNGKTALAAGLCLDALINDGEDGAEVLLAANSKDQASIAFEFCSKFASQLDPKHAYFQLYRDSIKFNANSSKLKVLAADSSTLDGFDGSFALIDEYHAAKDSSVRDVIQSSMGARDHAHICTITTAGFDKSSPCYQLRTVGLEVVSGVKEDDEMFVMIFSMDDGDDWHLARNWKKSNPNLDVTVNSHYIRTQVRRATNNKGDEVGVRTKNLNEWCDSSETWIPDAHILACTRDVDFLSFDDDEVVCSVGVDLAAISDLTAVAYLYVRDDTYYFRTDYYLPQSALVEKDDKERYKQWQREGAIIITDGNVTDYTYITEDMLRHRDEGITYVSVAYDKWNSTQWAIDATEQGLPLEEYSQSIGNFNKPTKELERLILSGKVVIDNNPITRFCFSNVTMRYDHNGNCKPSKALNQKKIDGVIAMIQALGVYMQSPHYSNTVDII